MDNFVIETASGKVMGFAEDGQIAFLGIPYAMPPVGELRLKRAVPVKPWEGVLDAMAYGPKAVQYNDGVCEGSEDCLTLNIRRPMEGENLPVLVYIHGGGYNSGCASDELYHGKSFVSHGIVYVSFQYRLNVFGFYDFTGYPGCEEFDSNCGLSDHIVAMQWIHENIRAFGGDPERVTIAGESAGGTSMIALMAAPGAKGTFGQVIASSALPNCFFTKETAKKNIDLFLEGMGWTEKDLPRLKEIDAYEVLKGNEYVAKEHQYRNPGIFLPTVSIDDLLPERPLEAIARGSAEGIRLMIGSNLHEGTMFVRPEQTNFPNSWDMVREMFVKNDNEAGFARIKDYYEKGNDGSVNGVEMAFINFATDYAFQMPAVRTAQAQKGHGPVWMYRYEFMSQMARKTGMLCSHAMDLPCDFNCLEFGFSAFVFQDEPKENVEKIVNDVHLRWVNFIKTGDPGQDWPQYAGYDSPVMIYDRTSGARQLDRTELMDVWGDMRFYED